MPRLLLLLLVGVFTACAPASAQSPVLNRADASVERASTHAGTTLRGVLVVPMPDGLHIQSNKPREAGLIPTALTFAPPAGVDVREVVFPASTDLDLPGYTLPLAVYEDELRIGVVFTIGASRTAGPVVVPARLRYQACDDRQCFRPLDLDVAWRFEIVDASVPLAAGRPTLFEGLTFGSGERPAIVETLPAAAPVATAHTAPGAAGTLALFDQFEVRGTGAYMTSDEFLTFVSNAEAGITPRGMFEGQGLFAILALVFVGGLALNLTPCVLPMIPINLAIIGAGAQGGNRRRGFVLGSVYGSAMALTYGLLGLVVILTAGTFGSLNSSPWFNVSIAVLFVVLALAMFDIITIDFSRLSSRIRFKNESRGTSMLAFGMGTVAALLAGACVAPVVIQVVLFASNLYATGTSAALALPFFLGIGMAIPWPIAGAGLASLPKPGPWMVRVKQAFGVLILGTAVYYGYLAYGLFADRFVDSAEVSSSVEEKLKAGWHSSLAEGLAVAEREGKPVLIDMWATWCKNCLTMDKTTLADPAVTAALDGYVKIKVQAEQPDEPPSVDLMKRFKAVGLPAYAIIRPSSKPAAD